MNRHRPRRMRRKSANPVVERVRQFFQPVTDFVRDRWRWFRGLSKRQQIALVGGITLLILILIPTLSYLYFIRDINDPERLMNRNNTGLVMTDIHGETIYSYGRSSDDRNASIEEIPLHTQQALIASEDRDFYDHAGFSPRNIAGAFYANVMNRDITRYGASTITQQLIKNNLLTDRASYLRKYQELAMSIAIERRYTKDQILEMYLNSVYFGEGAFGIIQAAETYFDKSPEELTLAESTVLIGLLPAPSAYSPISGDPELSFQQQERVLERMLDNDMITAEEQEAVLAQDLTYAEVEASIQEHAHHFTDMVLDELLQNYSEEEIARSGFRVETTLDLEWQQHAESNIKERINVIQHQGATNASLIAIDPRNGELRTLVGSVDWDDEDFGKVNMATTPRQPGSTFKPIYYAEAFENQIVDPSTIIRDERKEYGDYRPENFDFRFRGDVSIRHALATSLNIPAIEVMRKVGIQETIDTAQRMGITSITETPETYGLALALGTAETELREMTNAYAAFANAGDQYDTTTIRRIEDKFGRSIYENGNEARQVQSPQASYLVTSILADNNARAATFGSSLNVPNREVAVKTGTTNDNKDAWTIGYTPSLVVGVWVGDNTNQEMTIGGSAAAGPIWRTNIEHMLRDNDREEFETPRGVVGVRICNLHGNYIEYFIHGTQPDRCDPQISDDDIEERRRQEEEEERRRQEEEDRRREEERRRQQQQEEAEEDEEDEEEEDDDDEDEGEEEDDDDEDEGDTAILRGAPL